MTTLVPTTNALGAATHRYSDDDLHSDWTQDQLDRKARVLNGECVVASMRKINGRRRDGALLAWAEAEGRLVRIDRRTEWGNPFEMPDDGDRQAVIAKYSKCYLPHKDGLHSKTPTLRGKVLACWCYPEECHGDIIAEIVNGLSTDRHERLGATAAVDASG